MYKNIFLKDHENELKNENKKYLVVLLYYFIIISIFIVVLIRELFK